MLYEVEQGDPTQDEMMCFYKPPFWPIQPLSADCAGARSPSALVRESSGASVGGKVGTVQEFGKESGLPRKVQDAIDAVPAATSEALESFFEALAGRHPPLRDAMHASRSSASRFVDRGSGASLGHVASSLRCLQEDSKAEGCVLS